MSGGGVFDVVNDESAGATDDDFGRVDVSDVNSQYQHAKRVYFVILFRGSHSRSETNLKPSNPAPSC